MRDVKLYLSTLANDIVLDLISIISKASYELNSNRGEQALYGKLPDPVSEWKARACRAYATDNRLCSRAVVNVKAPNALWTMSISVND